MYSTIFDFYSTNFFISPPQPNFGSVTDSKYEFPALDCIVCFAELLIFESFTYRSPTVVFCSTSVALLSSFSHMHHTRRTKNFECSTASLAVQVAFFNCHSSPPILPMLRLPLFFAFWRGFRSALQHNKSLVGRGDSTAAQRSWRIWTLLPIFPINSSRYFSLCLGTKTVSIDNS